jgi:hypothetical protein
MLPATSNTSAVRYSRIATQYTAVVALTLVLAAAHDFNNPTTQKGTHNKKAKRM